MKTETIFRQFYRKRGRVGALLIPTVNRFVGDKPGIATTPSVLALRMVPTFDIRLVLVGHTYAQSIDLDTAGLGEMENEFLTTVEKFRRPDGFEMAPGDMASMFRGDGDGFDPVDGVLQDQKVVEPKHQLMG